MKLYIGVDLGTSAMKLLLMDAEGSIKNIVSKYAGQYHLSATDATFTTNIMLLDE